MFSAAGSSVRDEDMRGFAIKTAAAPNVTFVVPCYRLAHLLAECVESIVSQTYKEIEILIMDDQSPDTTAQVSKKIISSNTGVRISYILNEKNIGNIRNYNKGISLAQGKYVWIISPDDRLRSKYVLERYVRLMQSNVEIGYAFCSAHLIMDDKDAGLIHESVYRNDDQILDSIQLIKDMVSGKVDIVAPSVLIRKSCYDEISYFPVDMPHRGDTFVWSAIAMKYKAGFFAEPMVDYRVHSESMMSILSRENITLMLEDDVALPWRIKAIAENLQKPEIVEYCKNEIVLAYKRSLLGATYRGNRCAFSVEDVERSLERWKPDLGARRGIHVALARHLYWYGAAEAFRGKFVNARRFLGISFKLYPRLRYVPPLGQLVKTPDLGKRLLSLLDPFAKSERRSWWHVKRGSNRQVPND